MCLRRHEAKLLSINSYLHLNDLLKSLQYNHRSFLDSDVAVLKTKQQALKSNRKRYVFWVRGDVSHFRTVLNELHECFVGGASQVVLSAIVAVGGLEQLLDDWLEEARQAVRLGSLTLRHFDRFDRCFRQTRKRLREERGTKYMNITQNSY